MDGVYSSSKRALTGEPAGGAGASPRRVPKTAPTETVMRITAALLLIALTLGAAPARAQEEPAPVRAAALKRYGRTHVVSVTSGKSEGRPVFTVYTVLIASDKYEDRKRELTITADGDILSDVSMVDRPAAVTAALERAHPKAKLRESEVNAADQFRLTIVTEASRVLTLTVAPDGALVQTEEKIALANVPAAVVKAFVAKYPAASGYTPPTGAHVLTRPAAAGGRMSHFYRFEVVRPEPPVDARPLEERGTPTGVVLSGGVLTFAVFATDGTFVEETDSE